MPLKHIRIESLSDILQVEMKLHTLLTVTKLKKKNPQISQEKVEYLHIYKLKNKK